MQPTTEELAQYRETLQKARTELGARVKRIHEHARNPLDADSGEQAAQIGNVAVVSALEAEAVQELRDIEAALRRLEAGTYGICVSCGEYIGRGRLGARPAATECLDCAELA